MVLTQLIYVSRPFGFDAVTLNAILFSARHHNRLSGTTGALICREDIFLQFLEGSQTAINDTYGRIQRDGRHIDIKLLWSGESENRQFPEWDMRHDPAQSWLWTPEEVWAGAVLATPASDIRAIFTRLAVEPHDADIAL
jgi:Sensors of blue-light using FAD